MFLVADIVVDLEDDVLKVELRVVFLQAADQVLQAVLQVVGEIHLFCCLDFRVELRDLLHDLAEAPLEKRQDLVRLEVLVLQQRGELLLHYVLQLEMALDQDTETGGGAAPTASL